MRLGVRHKAGAGAGARVRVRHMVRVTDKDRIRDKVDNDFRETEVSGNRT